MREVKDFILGLKSEENVREPEIRKKIRRLAIHARQLVLRYKYANELENFLTHAEDIIENIRNDKFVQLLRHHAGLIASDLTYTDTSGHVRLDLDMISKLQAALLPYLADSLKYIPIPRIEASTPEQDYWVDNIVLCGYDIIPEKIRFQLESTSEFDVRQISPKFSETRLLIVLREIKSEVKDMEFYFKHKKFPEISDHGRVTVRMAGEEGATLRLTFRVEHNSENAYPNFSNGAATFHISKLEIIFDKHSLKHKVLIPLMTKLVKARVQQQLELAVEENINKFIHSIGARLTETLVKINRPLLEGLGTVRKVIKTSPVAQAYEKRREVLE